MPFQVKGEDGRLLHAQLSDGDARDLAQRVHQATGEAVTLTPWRLADGAYALDHESAETVEAAPEVEAEPEPEEEPEAEDAGEGEPEPEGEPEVVEEPGEPVEEAEPEGQGTTDDLPPAA